MNQVKNTTKKSAFSTNAQTPQGQQIMQTQKRQSKLSKLFSLLKNLDTDFPLSGA